MSKFQWKNNLERKLHIFEIISQKLVNEKFYLQQIAAVNLSKIYFLKNAKKTCKPNNRDLNRDWKRKLKTNKLKNLLKTQTF